MHEYPYERPVVADTIKGMGMKKRLLHIITGPRQVGKTTAALQVAEKWRGPVVNSSADSPLPQGPEGIQAQWERALYESKMKEKEGSEVLLILYEVQKVRGWSEVVIELWDKECREKAGIQVIILGSSSPLIQKDLAENLAGSFSTDAPTGDSVKWDIHSRGIWIDGCSSAVIQALQLLLTTRRSGPATLLIHSSKLCLQRTFCSFKRLTSLHY